MTIASLTAPALGAKLAVDAIDGVNTPLSKLAFGIEGEQELVSEDAPLPVSSRPDQSPAVSTPITGVANASAVVGPFQPELGRPIWISLSGVWAGTVTVRRSTNAGATKLPLTFIDGSAKGVWSGNVNAAIGEESVAAALFYLDIVLTSGSVTYRIEQ